MLNCTAFRTRTKSKSDFLVTMSKAIRATTIRRGIPSILWAIATIALVLVAIASPTHAHPRASASTPTSTSQLGPTTWTEHCRNDPDFKFTIRANKRNPSEVKCDWLKTKKKRRRKRHCKKTTTETGSRRTVSDYCAETCKACNNNDDNDIVLETKCPDELPPDGSGCSAFMDGLECDYDYKNTGGCGHGAPVSCYPIKTFTCREMAGDATWDLSTFVDLPCLGEYVNSDVGKSCCPPNEPKPLSKCATYAPGLECVYNLYIKGCGIDDPLVCTPAHTYTCEVPANADAGAVATWSLDALEISPCVGDRDPLVGQRCNPTASCPETKPENESNCPVELVGTDCDYDYKVTGCVPEDATCSPHSFYTCGSEKTWHEAVVDPPSCDNEQLPENCDPATFCPLLEPGAGSDCLAFPVSSSCEYGDEDGEERTYWCAGDEKKTWVVEE